MTNANQTDTIKDNLPFLFKVVLRKPLPQLHYEEFNPHQVACRYNLNCVCGGGLYPPRKPPLPAGLEDFNVTLNPLLLLYYCCYNCTSTFAAVKNSKSKKICIAGPVVKIILLGLIMYFKMQNVENVENVEHWLYCVV